MAQFSFDIESTYDLAEMNNVYDQVRRELSNRYDLKGTSADIDWLDDKAGFKITADNQMHLDAIMDMVRRTASKRGIDQKTFITSNETTESNMKITWPIDFINGLGQDEAKQITKLLRDELPKVKAQVQGESVRVMSPKKDQLQTAIQLIRSNEFDFPIVFTNLR
ncbi:MAG: YajQ family cyclic di-GMP-binding protein [Patescibacteria group bacterium]